jgi:hypothetical protein
MSLTKLVSQNLGPGSRPGNHRHRHNDGKSIVVIFECNVDDIAASQEAAAELDS